MLQIWTCSLKIKSSKIYTIDLILDIIVEKEHYDLSVFICGLSSHSSYPGSIYEHWIGIGMPNVFQLMPSSTKSRRLPRWLSGYSHLEPSPMT